MVRGDDLNYGDGVGFVFLERGGAVFGSFAMFRMSLNEYFQRWTVRGYCGGKRLLRKRSDVAELIGRRRTWRTRDAKTESFKDGNHPMLSFPNALSIISAPGPPSHSCDPA